MRLLCYGGYLKGGAGHDATEPRMGHSRLLLVKDETLGYGNLVYNQRGRPRLPGRFVLLALTSCRSTAKYGILIDMYGQRVIFEQPRCINKPVCGPGTI